MLAEANTVFAIDLLGQGASAKPANFQYTIETWAEVKGFPDPLIQGVHTYNEKLLTVIFITLSDQISFPRMELHLV